MNASKVKVRAFTVFSKELLDFPNICVRCGVQTGQKLAVKIGAGEPELKPTILLGHIGHVIEGIKELHSGSTRVPCCQKCHQYLLIGRWMAVGFLICGATILFIVSRYGGAWPDWLMISTGFVAFVMLCGSFIPYMVGEKKSAPVTIWKKSDGYYYLFHSGVYRSWAEELAVQYAETSNEIKEA
jgi:hypothetical protein